MLISQPFTAAEALLLRFLVGHLLLLDQRLLVMQNVALPLRDLALIAHPDLFGHLVYESEVVTDQHQSAFELVDCIGQGAVERGKGVSEWLSNGQ